MCVPFRAVRCSFLFLYQLLCSDIKFDIGLEIDQPLLAHCLFGGCYRDFLPKDASSHVQVERSVLADLAIVLFANTDYFGREPSLPKLDMDGFDYSKATGSAGDTTWYATPQSVEESDKKTPLQELLIRLPQVIKARAGDLAPVHSTVPTPKLRVTEPKEALGLFKRRKEEGISIADSSLRKRTLRQQNLGVLRLAAPSSDGAILEKLPSLSISVYEEQLRAAFTEAQQENRSELDWFHATRSLGYNLKTHKLVASHSVALGTIDRLEKDMKVGSAQQTDDREKKDTQEVQRQKSRSDVSSRLPDLGSLSSLIAASQCILHALVRPGFGRSRFVCARSTTLSMRCYSLRCPSYSWRERRLLVKRRHGALVLRPG